MIAIVLDLRNLISVLFKILEIDYWKWKNDLIGQTTLSVKRNRTSSFDIFTDG